MQLSSVVHGADVVSGAWGPQMRRSPFAADRSSPATPRAPAAHAVQLGSVRRGLTQWRVGNACSTRGAAGVSEEGHTCIHTRVYRAAGVSEKSSAPNGVREKTHVMACGRCVHASAALVVEKERRGCGACGGCVGVWRVCAWAHRFERLLLLVLSLTRRLCYRRLSLTACLLHVMLHLGALLHQPTCHIREVGDTGGA
jgi:hypothetical protein